MRVLTLDISQRVGWAITDGPSGVLDLRPYSLDFGRVGRVFADWLADQFVVHTPIKYVVIERPFSRAWTPAVYQQNGLVFTAHHVAERYDIARREVAPASWRKVVFGNGRMKTAEAKEAAIAFAKSQGVEPEDDNHADAVCLLEWAKKELCDAD